MAKSKLVSVAEAQEQFTNGRGYMSACTLGLPTQETIAALSEDLRSWTIGKASPGSYGAIVEKTRSHFSHIANIPQDRVAIGSQTSVMASLIAEAVPDNAEVLCVEGDFSSIIFPFLNQIHRGVTVRHVPIRDLANSITPSTWITIFSAVQSATGEIAQTEAIAAAARSHGSYTLCDTTQSNGWLFVDASEFDVTICHAYKWLCAPRGVAFLTLSEIFERELLPIQSGWYAGEDPWGSLYGPEMELAVSARKFDVSPAWQAWAGAEPALRLFSRIDRDALLSHVVGLGNALCEGLDMDPLDQAIVPIPDPNNDIVPRLSQAGIVASSRAGWARVAFHIWNDTEDVAALLRVLQSSRVALRTKVS